MPARPHARHESSPTCRCCAQVGVHRMGVGLMHVPPAACHSLLNATHAMAAFSPIPATIATRSQAASRCGVQAAVGRSPLRAGKPRAAAVARCTGAAALAPQLQAEVMPALKGGTHLSWHGAQVKLALLPAGMHMYQERGMHSRQLDTKPWRCGKAGVGQRGEGSMHHQQACKSACSTLRHCMRQSDWASDGCRAHAGPAMQSSCALGKEALTPRPPPWGAAWMGRCVMQSACRQRR